MILESNCQPNCMPPQQNEEMRNALRLKLWLAIKNAIEAKGLRHAEAALMARTPRTSITAIVNGNLERVSLDRLVNIAQRIGLRLSLRIS